MELTPATNEILEFSFEFQSLPAELQLEIFSWLDRDSLCQCAVVCHSWNDLAGNAALWKSLFKSRAGNAIRRYSATAERDGWKCTLKNLDETAHHRRCIECNGFPIDGVMWMCLLCDFGDDGLCDDCLRARPHDPTHILRKHYTKRCDRNSVSWDLRNNLSRDDLTHVANMCSECKRVPIVGSKYQCISCADFQLCHSCYRSEAIRRKHRSAHRLVRIKRPGIVFDDSLQLNSEMRNRFPYACMHCRKTYTEGCAYCLSCQSVSSSSAAAASSFAVPHLCLQCAKEKHSGHNVFYRSSSRVHFASCDGAFCQGGSILGVRYRCAICRDFDLCEICESVMFSSPQLANRHPHPFIQITSQAQRDALMFYTHPRDIHAPVALHEALEEDSDSRSPSSSSSAPSLDDLSSGGDDDDDNNGDDDDADGDEAGANVQMINPHNASRFWFF